MAEITTTARPYAKAAFGHAVEHRVETKWLEFLERCEALLSDDTLRDMLKNPRLTAQAKAQVMVDLTAELSVDGSGAFLETLAYYGRLTALPEITRLFRRLLAGQQQAVDVTITSAYPLSDADVSLLEAKLKIKYAGQSVRIDTAVDPSLIGGFQVRSTDTVIDASVRGRLAKIADALTV